MPHLDKIKEFIAVKPNKFSAIGLRTSTIEQIEEIKVWLRAQNVPFEHRTMLGAIKLPFNGVLYINPSKLIKRIK
jgi:hypothetical protein